MSESPIVPSKDLEGISDTFDQGEAPAPAAAAPGAKPTKQRKIAVLTSGGDSAGMNAAGT
jgi:6-phosphofructokinase 1